MNRTAFSLSLAAALLISTVIVAAPSVVNAQVAPPTAQEIALTGTVRDFQRSHPDFESFDGVDRAMVDSTLGADSKPVYAYTPPASSPTTSSKTTFDQWYRDVPGVNESTDLTLTLDKVSDAPSVYRFDESSFFPIDGALFGNEGEAHNYWFTFELHAEFTYQGGEEFNFRGDDDVWVFIDDELVIDLGGLHEPESAGVNLDQLGLTIGETYPLDLFFAERRAPGSSFRIETTLELDAADGAPAAAANVGVQAPIADAGFDQTVTEGQTVQLDASGSSDPNPGQLIPSFSRGNLPGGTGIEVAVSGLDSDFTIATTASIGKGPAIANSALVYIVDLSGSANFTGGCAGDQNNDNLANRIIDCEIAAVLELHEQVLASGTVAEVGLVTFSSGAAARDLDPTAATAFLIAPDADADGNGVLDLEQVLRSLRTGGSTNFRAAVDRTCGLLAGSVASNRLAAFISDGEATAGAAAVNGLPCDPPVGFQTFAIGGGASCVRGRAGSRLQEIADVTGGICTDVPDVGNLPDILPDVIGSRLVRAELSIDGGPLVDISDQVTPSLPAAGPTAVNIAPMLPPLADGRHEICITITGRDAGGEGSVTTCSELRIGDAPLSYRWDLIDGDGPPIVLSSTTDPSPSFQTADDATYLFEVTVTNGFELTATDRVTVTVANSDPVIEVAPSDGVAGGVTLVNASFIDAGYVDVHTATINWGDGLLETIPVTAQGSGWGGFFGSHIYAESGSYDIEITVVDDDGGVAASSLAAFEVADPIAVFANGTGDRSIDWTGGSGSIEGRVHTNGEFRVTGRSKTVTGPTTAAGALNLAVNRHNFDPAPSQAPTEDFPYRFDIVDYRPDGVVATEVGSSYNNMSSECVDGKWHDPQIQLDRGVYYVDCDVQLNGSDIGGEVTIVAEGSIKISGSRPAFEPFVDGLLFLSGASGRAAIDVSASSSQFLGVMFAEYGQVDLAGNNNRFFCGILGDTIDISGSNTNIRGANCGRDDATVAGPLLVPELEVTLTGTPDVVSPGSTIDYRVEASNTGALLVVPGLLGLENVDDAAATVASYAYLLEYFSVDEQVWVPFASAAAAVDGYVPTEALPTLGGLTLATRPNPNSGVTYPVTVDSIVGSIVAPGGFATWGAQALVELESALVEQLLDPALVSGVRNRVAIETMPSDVQVRRLFEFGSDFIDDLRALSGDVTAVDLTLTRPSGDPLLLDAAFDPALGSIGPGETVALESVYDVAAPVPRGEGETDDAYVARLRALDAAALVGAVSGRGTGGVGLLVAPLQVALADQQLPVLSVGLEGPSFAFVGEVVEFDQTVRNVGSADALAVVDTGRIDGADAVFAPPVPSTLNPAQVASGTASLALAADRPTGTVSSTSQLTWSDGPGNVYGPVRSAVQTVVGEPAALTASLADSLLVDLDGNGLVSPGDTIRYEAIVDNTGDTDLTDVTIDIPTDANSSVVSGSATATDGTVVEGADVTTTLATLAGRTGLTVTFDVIIDDPLADNVGRLSVQGAVTSAELDPVLTDDPAIVGVADPTVTRIVVPSPVLSPTLRDSLVVDSDGNGVASPGDTIRYDLVIGNDGTSTATEVTTEIPIPTGSSIVGGSVMADGVVDGTNGSVTASLADIVSGGTVTLTFDVTVDVSLPNDLTQLEAQAMVESAEVAPALSDDPDTAEEADATITPIVRPGTGGGTGGGGGGGGGTGTGSTGNGLPAPTVGAVVPSPEVPLTQPTTITTTLTAPAGESVVGWTVVLRRSDGSEVELDTGSGADVAAVVDPTALANGAYEILVIAESSNGGISVTESQVLVAGDFKPGRVRLTLEDLEVQVGAASFRLLRSYDSFATARSDFGHGWSLDVADFAIRTNGRLGQGGWRQDVIGGGFIFSTLGYTTTVPHYVTVTWPDGRNELFDLTPSNGSTFFAGLTSAEFEGRPGTTSTLEALDSGLFFRGDGNLYGGLFGTGGVYNPTRFRLTDVSGNEFVLDTRTGLVSSRDTLGNTLNVSAGGITNSNGEGVSFNRDALGRITTITSTAGDALTYDYDADGDLIAFTDAANTVGYTYVAGHLLDQILGEGGAPLQILEYGPDGRLVAIIDGAGNRTEVSFDIGAGSETRTDPEGRLTTIDTYDADGRLVRTDQVADGETRTTTFGYDAVGRPNFEQSPTGEITRLEYDSKGNVTSVEQPGGPTFGYSYDTKGRATQETIDGVLSRRLTYSSAGLLTEDDRLSAGVISYGYGAGGQLTSTTQNGVTTTYGYTNGKITSIAEGGAVTRASYSGNLVTQVITPDGATTAYEYDANELLTATVDDTGRRYEYRYDSFGRLLTEIDPTHGPIQYGYDGAGRVTTIVDRNGDTTTLAYDRNGQVTQTVAPDDTATFTYDGFGRMTSAADDDSLLEFAYGPTDQPLSQIQSGPGLPTVEISWAYGVGGDLLSRTTPAGTVDVSRNDRREVDSLTATGMAAPITFDYDDIGRQTTRTLPNGVLDEQIFAAGGLLGRRTSSLGTSVIHDWTATYGSSGRRTTLEVNGVTTGFGYDLAGRLTTAGSAAFGYDTVGNRTSAPGVATATFGPSHRLLADGLFDYSYDSSGNLVAQIDSVTSDVTTYDWDVANRLVEIVRPDATTVSYRRDALGRVIEIDDDGDVTSFVHDGSSIVLEYDGADTLSAWYVPDEATGIAHAVQRDGDWYYLVVDGHGSVVAVTDAAGAVAEAFDYDAWGQLLGAAPTIAPAYSYAGLGYDTASGLYDARARYYDASIGRFISVDPIPALNPYAYASNDPVSLIDPLGETASVEYSGIVSRSTVQAAVISEIAARICGAALNTAIALGTGTGPNGLGSAAEQFVRDALGIDTPDRTPYDVDGRKRIPDILTDSDIIEVKNVKRQSFTRQIRDLVERVKNGGRGGVLVVREGTKLSGPLRAAARRTPGFIIVACLPG